MKPAPEPNPVRDEPYAGASNATIALGKGYILGWVGKVIGAVAGAGITALGTGESSYLARKGSNLLESLKVKNPQGKWVVVTGGAFVGAVVGHYIGLGLGTKRGFETAQEGRDQFERIKAERNLLAKQVELLEAKPAGLHREPGRDADPLPHGKGSHVAAHEAKKEAVAAEGHGR